MQIKGIKVEWTQTFEHHCISKSKLVFPLLNESYSSLIQTPF